MKYMGFKSHINKFLKEIVPTECLGPGSVFDFLI